MHDLLTFSRLPLASTSPPVIRQASDWLTSDEGA